MPDTQAEYPTSSFDCGTTSNLSGQNSEEIFDRDHDSQSSTVESGYESQSKDNLLQPFGEKMKEPKVYHGEEATLKSHDDESYWNESFDNSEVSLYDL